MHNFGSGRSLTQKVGRILSRLSKDFGRLHNFECECVSWVCHIDTLDSELALVLFQVCAYLQLPRISAKWLIVSVNFHVRPWNCCIGLLCFPLARYIFISHSMSTNFTKDLQALSSFPCVFILFWVSQYSCDGSLHIARRALLVCCNILPPNIRRDKTPWLANALDVIWFILWNFNRAIYSPRLSWSSEP